MISRKSIPHIQLRQLTTYSGYSYMRWKIINPVFYTLIIVLVLVLLFWTEIVINSPAPNKLQSYLEVLKIFFHPLSLPNYKYIGDNNTVTYLFITGGAWFIAYIFSAQPYYPRLRITGNIIGIFAVLGWVSIVLIVVIISGLRH